MDIIKDTDFTDERSLFQGKNLQIDNCTFQIGESPLKESENIDIKNRYLGFNTIKSWQI